MIHLLALLFSLNANAQTFTDELCDDYHKVAQDFIEAELSGMRWQGTEETPLCLKRQKPTTVPEMDRIPAGDPSFLDPEYILPNNRAIQFQVKKVQDNLIEVVMNYIGKKNKKDIPVKDSFILRLNYGRSREIRGCASMYSEPSHFVMREKCWKE